MVDISIPYQYTCFKSITATNGRFPDESEINPLVVFLSFGTWSTGFYRLDALPVTQPTMSKH